MLSNICYILTIYNTLILQLNIYIYIYIYIYTYLNNSFIIYNRLVKSKNKLLNMLKS